MKKNKNTYTATVSLEFIEQFKQQFLEDIDRLFQKRLQQSPPKQSLPLRWIKSAQVMQMLDISPGKLQHMRINGYLPFSKVGGVIFYDVADINKMLELRKRNFNAVQ